MPPIFQRLNGKPFLLFQRHYLMKESSGLGKTVSVSLINKQTPILFPMLLFSYILYDGPPGIVGGRLVHHLSAIFLLLEF